MRVGDLRMRDYHDLGNALMEGESAPAVASFHIEWAASRDRHRFRYPPEKWAASVVFNSAQVAWRARTRTATFVSDPAPTSMSLFAEVGVERSGVFFS